MTDANRKDSQQPQSSGADTHTITDDMLVIVPVRNLVLFPGTVVPVAINRDRSLAAAQEAVRNNRKVGFLLQHDPDLQAPTGSDLYATGTVANIVRYVTGADGTHHLVVQGERRFRVLDWQNGLPYMVARVEYLPDPSNVGSDVEARALNLKRLAAEAISLLPQAPAELSNAIQSVESASTLADLVASFMDVKPAEKQELLETLDLKVRLERVSALLQKRIEVLRLQRQLEEKTRDAIDERHKEVLLREQLRQIRKELGEEGEAGEEIAELREAIEKAGMPEEAKEQAEKELKRLERMSDASAEYSMLRTWLDWMIQLPWSKLDKESIEIEHARKVLDEDHFGLDKIKRRIVEYLAVRKLNPQGRSPILCFVGPPGVGKTSLGQSIARSLGVKFARVSLGGVHDEAEIRGHRRTYIGALPGNIIQAIRKAGTRNSVLMLDEIDKLGAGIQGDPSAALLEVLDPEQNNTFRDNYLGVPFDLSKVVFIATANMLDTIPGPLRDRMEVIELTGYTEDEKVEIAKRYLMRRQLEANGLKPEQASITDDALRQIARDHTREAGVRSFERMIGSVLRNVAVKIAEGTITQQTVDVDDLAGILGAPRFENEVAMRVSVPGVATGLAWTPVGGDILFIESTRVPGNGKLILTGQLGDVMKESAQAALSLLKSQAARLGIDTTVFDKSDVHIHVPAGAIPKDGPSAGVSMFTSLVSLFTNKTVRSDLAMTGEISLRGLVLPIGGVKEKTVAAHRAGIRKVLLPARNRKDLEDVPKSVRDEVEFVFCERVDDVVREALDIKLNVAQVNAAA
ncbi:endopeptidase La [Steroidobacter agaridevorans]|uniref:endopeptidase La n=1 Tax=Steroidobacter agaridevorans TaxID=2695856 RepID=UPI00132B3BCE|nr:endopeptidase La [Steroidobacter agaridevorans]GFE91258.1 Lon protease [Steroidobacter agaridevorans]